MDLNAISSNAASVAATISGVRGASGWELGTIPGTPYVVLGMSQAAVTPGDRTVVRGQVPMRLYVERLDGVGPRDAQATNSYIGVFVTTFALDQDLGGTVTDSYITAWQSDVFYKIGEALYAAVDFTLSFYVDYHVPQALRTVLP